MQIGSVQFGGLASGLDTRALIDAILNAERRPITRLQSREFQLTSRKSALDQMRTKLSDFLAKMRDLSTDRTMQGRTTIVSDDTAFTATAGTAGEVGLFSVEVFELAAAHKLTSGGLTASDEGLISDGTITIQSGDNDPITVDVSASSGNNTLEGVRDAINSADAGVRAAIIFDGSEYHLTVRAEESGLDNALSITDSTNLNLQAPVSEVLAADARIEIDGVEITSATNTISGAIPGVILDLVDTTEGTPVTLQVEQDIEGAVAGVQGLVDAYNEAIDFFNEQFDRDNPGALATDSFARRLRSTLQGLVTSGVEGIPLGGIRALSSIGVDFDGRTGKMSLDSGELTELLEERFDEVSALFLASGSASDPFIQFISSGSNAVSGEYAVEITQAAERASVVGERAIRAAGLKDDETLTIALGSDTVDVDLTAGMLIGDVVAAVNAGLTSAGIDAKASDDGGALRISTNGYGSDTTVSVTSNLSVQGNGNGKQTGFDLTAATDAGQDVAGTIGGVAATGAGQLLTGAEGEDFADLTIRVTATAADIAGSGGDFGTVSFSAGLNQRLIAELSEVTRFGDGRIDSAKDIIDDQLRGISDNVRRLEERLVSREAYLVRTFAEAERAISILQAQQAQLGSASLF